jgi:N-acetylglucosamine-6-sulfatase
MSRAGLLALAIGAGAVPLVLVLGDGSENREGPHRAGGAPPNIVVVMTDDQAVGTIGVMSEVASLLAEQGVTFESSYVSYPLCCPSRATYLTGQYAHNHGVLGAEQPPSRTTYASTRKSLATDTLPIWLRRAGYVTAHIGKYMNGYGDYQPTEVPPGWTEWYAPAGKDSTYGYDDFKLNQNGHPVRYGSGRKEAYQTDVLTEKAVDFISDRAPSHAPFFLSVAYLAPHRGQADGERCSGSARPAPRHERAFAAEELAGTPSINEADVSDKPELVRKLDPLGAGELEHLTTAYRCQLESLLAVDEGVAAIHRALEQAGELDQTVLIFTSDNGLLQGEHRLTNSKLFPYQEALRVPLIVRGAGGEPGTSVVEPVLNVDLAPTILELARAKRFADRPLDGRSFVPLLGGDELPERDMLFEAYVQHEQTGGEVEKLYSAIRRGSVFYVEWSNGDRELYDLAEDPFQLESRHDDNDLQAVRTELAGRLAELRGCAGRPEQRVPGKASC